MKYPTLYPRQRSQQTIDVFAGYNHNIRIGENEFYDMRNLTSDVTPVLSPRKCRGLYQSGVQAEGMIAKDALCYVDGRYFVMNQYRIDMGLSTKPEDCPKQLVSMGAYVIILPDKKYINTGDISGYGSIEAKVITMSPVTFTPCKSDGTALLPDYLQPTAPEEPANMELWMDTSSTPHSLKQWSESMGMWTSVATTYVKIQCAGIGKGFSEFDGVTITVPKGLDAPTASQLEALNGATFLFAVDEDSVTVVGLLDESTTIEDSVTISREMPDMDFVVENDNRLWGCRYGLNKDGDVVNELYACKQGDFKNWNCFMGIATDSYGVTLGSDGAFTGAIVHSGYPIFFKENCMHKVYGQIPANFQVQSTVCRGVQRGCDRSLAIVNEVLFYKSRHAICAYDGSVPTEISGALGDIPYSTAVAAAHGNKYYVSMEERNTGNWSFFVFDTAKNMWHREDDLRAKILCSCRDELYCATEDGNILAILGSGDRYEESVPWMAETGIIGGSTPERKYLCKMNIRMVLECGSSMEVLAQYDSCGVWESLGYFTGTDLRSFTVPVLPRRCDHLRLRLEGEGSAMIFSITKIMSVGSDKT